MVWIVDGSHYEQSINGFRRRLTLDELLRSWYIWTQSYYCKGKAIVLLEMFIILGPYGLKENLHNKIDAVPVYSLFFWEIDFEL